MQRFIGRRVITVGESLRLQRCFSQATQKQVPVQENGLDVPKIPPFDYSPPPYTGPTANEILAKRKQYLSPSMFYFYKKPIASSKPFLSSNELMAGIIRISNKIQCVIHINFKQKFSSSPSPKRNGLGQKERIEHGRNFASATGINPRNVNSFDICFPESKSSAVLKPYLQARTDGFKNEIKHKVEGEGAKILRSGMVLLKHYINHSEQVKIVRTIQKLGRGPGGFYKTGPRRALMGLGLTWDPIKYKYEFRRSVDGSETQPIPLYLSFLVKKSLQDAQSHIEKVTNLTSVESILPSMSPNTAIINFYPTGGGLNLHQDRNESRESLRKGLPVVSFSIGDSGEFLYGDDRDEYAAEKVILESGDLMIFGGKSRHIFHGVRSVIPNSAPKELLEETRLRPGRLNLTFREY